MCVYVDDCFPASVLLWISNLKHLSSAVTKEMSRMINDDKRQPADILCFLKLVVDVVDNNDCDDDDDKIRRSDDDDNS